MLCHLCGRPGCHSYVTPCTSCIAALRRTSSILEERRGCFTRAVCAAHDLIELWRPCPLTQAAASLRAEIRRSLTSGRGRPGLMRSHHEATEAAPHILRYPPPHRSSGWDTSAPVFFPFFFFTRWVRSIEALALDPGPRMRKSHCPPPRNAGAEVLELGHNAGPHTV